MKLNREGVRALADSCRIALTDAEAEQLAEELNELLVLADRLEGGSVPCGGADVPCRLGDAS